VPVLWRYEVSAVLAKSQKDGILTALKADEFLATLNKLNITVDPDSSNRILTDSYRLAVSYRLTSYGVLPGAGPPKKVATGNARRRADSRLQSLRRNTSTALFLSGSLALESIITMLVVFRDKEKEPVARQRDDSPGNHATIIDHIAQQRTGL
jgi:hypothetical protein